MPSKGNIPRETSRGCYWLGPTACFRSDPLLTQSRRVQVKSRCSRARDFAVLCGRAIFAAIRRASSFVSTFRSLRQRLDLGTHLTVEILVPIRLFPKIPRTPSWRIIESFRRVARFFGLPVPVVRVLTHRSQPPLAFASPRIHSKSNHQPGNKQHRYS